ncbi:hypothetical protein [Stieleria maiorica]|nr:hypothetical protein [Stieleria maiorica]
MIVINFIARQSGEGEGGQVISDFLKPVSPQTVDRVIEDWTLPHLG